MAAGLGFKDFTTGEVLTAADVDGYLMQGIWVFANATARDAAVTSPQEGNSCYLKDTDVIQVYSGSSWVVKSGGSSPLTTKGDLYTYSTTDTRIGVGANDTVLTADSSTASGLKWAAPSSGGMTLISTTAMTGASITLSSIPSGYVDLKLVLVDPYMSDDQENIKIRLNSNSSTVYTSVGTNGGSTVAFDGTDYLIAYNLDNTLHSNLIDFYLFNYSNSTTWKIANTNSISRNGVTSTSANFTTGNLLFGSTTAITSILVFATGGSFSGGTAYLYGVK
jgi:hypothetical protein